MSRILHASFLSVYHNSIAKQLSWETEAAKSLTIDFVSVLVVPETALDGDMSGDFLVSLKIKKVKLRILRWLLERYYFAKWLIANAKRFDIVLVRWSLADPFLLYAVLKIKKPIYTVHHSFEEEEARLSARFGGVRAILDRIIFKIAAKKNTGIIGVTPEIVDYELARAKTRLRGLVYPNGVYLEPQTSICCPIGNADHPELVFVSTYFSEWQGLDILLESIAEDNSDFTLNLVGELTPGQKSSVANDKRIKCHGTLSTEQLIKLYRICDVGLSAFALFRKGIKQACTLKVREYLSCGIPVYAGHDDIFPSTFPYYRKGPAIIREVLLFAREVSSFERNDIRDGASKYISKKDILNRLFDELTLNHSNEPDHPHHHRP